MPIKSPYVIRLNQFERDVLGALSQMFSVTENIWLKAPRHSDLMPFAGVAIVATWGPISGS